MSEQETRSSRVRAWILIRADSPQTAAERIYDGLGQADDDRFVVVRADVVDNHYNIVVPVDAQDWDVLQDVAARIQRLAEATDLAILRVVEHIPYPPHLADGYISEDEAAAYTGPETIKIGRQRNSPGWNAWG